ncbi:MAG: hypothetical protein HN794_04290, partial [Euryarchaeota archaeon]|nr:hypothetical protein [Euryarchaeota archaeon]
MAEIFGYGDKDQDKLTYFVVALVSVICVVFVNYFEVLNILDSTIIAVESSIVPGIILTIFRTGATILAFYT